MENQNDIEEARERFREPKCRGLMREGKSMADYPYLDDYAKPMLDELVWWADTLKEGRSRDMIAEAA